MQYVKVAIHRHDKAQSGTIPLDSIYCAS